MDFVVPLMELPDTSVGFIGAGRMAQALSKGFIDSKLIPVERIMASDVTQSMLDFISISGVKTTSNNSKVVQESDIIVIAVKPNMVSDVLNEVHNSVSRDKIIVSIAAGVKISTLESLLPVDTRVFRVMPNTPALVQCGASVCSAGSCTETDDGRAIAALFASIGIVESLPEKYLDVVTGLSGSGPAYGFMAIEALSDGAVKMGLPRDVAIRLAAQTLLGASKMVLETGKHPGELKDAVCSPGGTTIAAVHELEKNGFRCSLINAVEAATKRSEELAKK